jgi:hypothetical protein
MLGDVGVVNAGEADPASKRDRHSSKQGDGSESGDHDEKGSARGAEKGVQKGLALKKNAQKGRGRKAFQGSMRASNALLHMVGHTAQRWYISI